MDNNGVQIVYPIEARRDVLMGKVAYLFINEKGSTLFQPQHMFAALKLAKGKQKIYEGYTCMGGRSAVVGDPEAWQRKKPISYKRRYISQKLIAKGIYGVSFLCSPPTCVVKLTPTFLKIIMGRLLLQLQTKVMYNKCNHGRLYRVDTFYQNHTKCLTRSWK